LKERITSVGIVIIGKQHDALVSNLLQTEK